jgi:hypothetical protein
MSAGTTYLSNNCRNIRGAAVADSHSGILLQQQLRNWDAYNVWSSEDNSMLSLDRNVVAFQQFNAPLQMALVKRYQCVVNKLQVSKHLRCTWNGFRWAALQNHATNVHRVQTIDILLVTYLLKDETLVDVRWEGKLHANVWCNSLPEGNVTSRGAYLNQDAINGGIGVEFSHHSNHLLLSSIDRKIPAKIKNSRFSARFLFHPYVCCAVRSTADQNNSEPWWLHELQAVQCRWTVELASAV